MDNNQQHLPLLCWDIVSMGLLKFKHKTSVQGDFNQLKNFKKEFNWKVDLDSILEVPYDALIITNKDQIIQWTNEGFEKMTGYSSDFAIGRRPKFLQGKKTSLKSKRNIRERLFEAQVITGTVLNYRKNNEEYLCELKIYPLTNKQEELTHFIAFERELS